MALYLIGDVQGCDPALQRLLDTIAFSPSRDTLYLLGDLVNRGPASEATLRRLMGYGEAARCLLGNHDLHLLALAHGVRPAHKHDSLQGILTAPDRSHLLEWLRQQPLARHEHGILMVHAGVLPEWTTMQAMAFAGEVHAQLRGNHLIEFLQHMYGSQPSQWRDDLAGADRLRVIVNALTRMRYCSASGEMEFTSKDANNAPPAGFMPWFDVAQRKTETQTIAFGHWSTLGYINRPHLLCLDTGCVWGGCLSALRFAPDHNLRELIQVQCEQAQRPGL